MLDENPFHLSKGKIWSRMRMKRAGGGGGGEGVGEGGGEGGSEGGGGEDVDDEELFPRSIGSYRDAPQSVSVVAKLK